jgi:hypothetical protein
MPPPHHHEYTIYIGPGSKGRVVFAPDYPGPDVPVWTESFAVSGKALDALYELVAARVLGREWAKVTDGVVGGSLEWLTGTAGGERFRVPSRIPNPEIVKDVYAAVKALVPEVAWARLRVLREQYEQDYEDRGHDGFS